MTHEDVLAVRALSQFRPIPPVITLEIKNKVQFGQSEQRFLGRGFAQGWGIYFHHNREKTYFSFDSKAVMRMQRKPE
jgi:hypothetical protein